MAPPIKIAVLLADEKLPLLVHDKPTLQLLFAQLLQKPDYELSIFNSMKGEYPDKPEAFDACLITGSKYSVLKPTDWSTQLGDFILASKYKRLIGVCYGHQLIAQTLGGQVQRLGWHIGTNQLHFSESKIFMPINDIFARFHHEDHVTKLPPGAERIAQSSHCQNALFQISHRILGMQYHPEFTLPYHLKLLQTRMIDKLDKPEYTHFKHQINRLDTKDYLREIIKRFLSQPIA